MAYSVDQKNARPGGDAVGRDKITNHIHQYSSSRKIEALMEKLAHEIATNEETRQQIDTLQLYFERRSHDGVEGLESKLEHSGRADCKLDAFAKKELFAKLLTRYSLYASA